jgi:hypothetical protein
MSTHTSFTKLKRGFGVFARIGVLSMVCDPAFSQTLEKPEFSLSGFATVAAGKVLGGTQDAAANLDFDCPCYIADYGQAAVYQGRKLSFKPDTKLGVQGRVASADQRYSLTGQLVARGAVNGKINLEWLYGTAEITPSWTAQIGRQRLPLFMHSDVQDVGQALNAIRLPAQLYGWEIVNYNGAALRYNGQMQGGTLSANAFAGSETNRNSGYWKIYNGQFTQTSSKWSAILGGTVKYEKEWLTVRGLFMQSNTQNRDVLSNTAYSPKLKQRIAGVSIGADFGGPFVNAELLWINRVADYGRDAAQLLTAGYRLGQFTPQVSYANYKQRLLDPSAPAEAHRSISAVLRYDLNSSSAFKLQYDVWLDRSQAGFGSQHGNARLLSLSFDKVF